MNSAGVESRKKRLIHYLCIIGLFAIFSTTIAKNPVIPLYADSLGAGSAVIGLISAVSPFAGILLSFPVGVLSDQRGRRRLLILAGFGSTFASSIMIRIATVLRNFLKAYTPRFRGCIKKVLGKSTAA